MPTMKVVELQHRTQLLAGSNGQGEVENYNKSGYYEE